MRYVLLTLATVFALDVSLARADPIPTFRVMDATMSMNPNQGAGDHILFAFTGPGVDIEGRGGMPCFSWCDGNPIPPGVSVALRQIFVSSYGKAVLGGVAYSPNTEFDLGALEVFNDSGGLNPIAMGFSGSGPTFSQFRLILPTNGNWTLNFAPATDEFGNATKRFLNGTFSASAMAETPDPGTLGLMFIGSAGVWITRRRRRFCHVSRLAADCRAAGLTSGRHEGAGLDCSLKSTHQAARRTSPAMRTSQYV